MSRVVHNFQLRLIFAQKKVITGDESWMYGYDIEIEGQSSQLKHPEEPRPKKLCPNVKILLIVLFDCTRVVPYEFLSQGRMVNKKYQLEVIRRLHEAIRQKRTELWKDQ